MGLFSGRRILEVRVQAEIVPLSKSKRTGSLKLICCSWEAAWRAEGARQVIRNPNLESVWNQNREQHGTVPGVFRQHTCGIALFFSVQHRCHGREDAHVPLKTVLTDLCCPPAAAGGLVARPLGTNICMLLCGMKCAAYNFCTRFCKLYHLCIIYNIWHSTDAVSLVIILYL